MYTTYTPYYTQLVCIVRMHRCKKGERETSKQFAPRSYQTVCQPYAYTYIIGVYQSSLYNSVDTVAVVVIFGIYHSYVYCPSIKYINRLHAMDFLFSVSFFNFNLFYSHWFNVLKNSFWSAIQDCHWNWAILFRLNCDCVHGNWLKHHFHSICKRKRKQNTYNKCDHVIPILYVIVVYHRSVFSAKLFLDTRLSIHLAYIIIYSKSFLSIDLEFL